MRSTLEQFHTTLIDLEDFVKSIDPVNSLLAGQRDTLIRRYVTVRRRLDYAAFVVGLYAAFEKFVEDLVWSYTDVVASMNRYVDLPVRMRGKHLKESAEMLSRGRLGEGRYAGVTDADVISNLHSCLSGESPYRLNRHAIVHHDLNLRAEVLTNIFGAVGVDGVNDVARSAEPLVRWYSDAKLESSAEPTVPLTLIDLRLKDLVERRNQLTHGGSDSSDSLGAPEMSERLQFLRSFGHALFNVVAGAYLHRRYVERTDASFSLGEIVEGPFKEGTVVVLAKPSASLSRGHALLGVTGGRVDRWGVIEELQVDNASVENVDISSNAKTIGVRVDFKVSDKTKLHALVATDDLVWG